MRAALIAVGLAALLGPVAALAGTPLALAERQVTALELVQLR